MQVIRDYDEIDVVELDQIELTYSDVLIAQIDDDFYIVKADSMNSRSFVLTSFYVSMDPDINVYDKPLDLYLYDLIGEGDKVFYFKSPQEAFKFLGEVNEK